LLDTIGPYQRLKGRKRWDAWAPAPSPLPHTTPSNAGKRMLEYSRSRRALAAAGLTLLSAATVVLQSAQAHPGCRPGGITLIQEPNNQFCPTDKDPLYDDGFCCDAGMEAEIELALDGSGATGKCAAMYQEVRKDRGRQRSCGAVRYF